MDSHNSLLSLVSGQKYCINDTTCATLCQVAIRLTKVFVLLAKD